MKNRLLIMLLIGGAVVSGLAIVFWKYIKDVFTPTPPDPNTTAQQQSELIYAGTGGGGSVSTPEVFSSNIDLTGAAPSGYKWGYNYINQKTFYVDGSGVWQQSPVGSVTPFVPITATYTPPTIENSQIDIHDLNMAGVLLASHYSVVNITNISATPNVEFTAKVIADNTVRLYITNNNGTAVSLPTLTISALKLS